MALIKCSECQRDISDKAEFCPGCGLPMSNKSKLTVENSKPELESAVSDNKSEDVDGSGCFGLSLIILVLLILVLIAKCSSNSDSAKVTGYSSAASISASERYPGPWMDDGNPEIIRALISNKIEGCGEFQYRKSYDNTSEYLVYCTRDGKNWVSYIVFPRDILDSDVQGPYRIDPSIPP